MSRIVLKLGGAVAEDAAAFAHSLAATHEVCVVHGAGPQISAELERAGLEVRFVGGRRVTSLSALAVVRRSFAAVNAAVCAAIGAEAVPLFGDEIGLEAVRIAELGHVGSPVPSRPPAIELVLAAGFVPVVAPLAAGPLNVNADEAAAALAIGLRAEKLLFVSDVPGVLLGGAVAAAISADEAEQLLDTGELGAGSFRSSGPRSGPHVREWTPRSARRRCWRERDRRRLTAAADVRARRGHLRLR
jgi:acetylglutamate kinase